MTDTLALENLYNGVTQQFAFDHTLTPNFFGWRERAQLKAPGNKIVWVPGNEPNAGDVGKHGPPSKMSQDNQNPRSLATLLEVFTVYVCGYDGSKPENEMAQYKAARFLYDAWFRALWYVAHGTFTIETLTWDRSKTERQHGAMLIAVCTVQAMIPDTPAVPIIDAKADVTPTMLDQTDPAYEVDPA